MINYRNIFISLNLCNVCVIIILTTTLLSCNLLGPSSSKYSNKREMILRHRIIEFHDLWKNKNYSDFFYEFIVPQDRKNTTKEEYLKNGPLISQIIDYKIESIVISHNIAEVSIRRTYNLNNIVMERVLFSIWVFENDNWYLADDGHIQPYSEHERKLFEEFVKPDNP